ncbi:MAG TPA: MotA/TolQ/ExbB proton channel family protein, partial [Cyclobacteriaceae bacterium]|nr:MotA/TolQ/ExbB proton channel family protein [Cyclobacteriaceae bacterium]
MMLAQIVTGSETATTAAEQSISMWSLVMAGGPLMIPLAICSVIAIYIFVERVLTVNKANVNSDVFMGRIKELVQ